MFEVKSKRMSKGAETMLERLSKDMSQKIVRRFVKKKNFKRQKEYQKICLKNVNSVSGKTRHKKNT